jgi:hypothetical protein
VLAKVGLWSGLVFSASALASTIGTPCPETPPSGSVFDTGFSFSCAPADHQLISEQFSGFSVTALMPPNSTVPTLTIPTATYEVVPTANGQAVSVTLDFAFAEAFTDQSLSFIYSADLNVPKNLGAEADQISLVTTGPPVFTYTGPGQQPPQLVTEYACASAASCPGTPLGLAVYPSQGNPFPTSALFPNFSQVFLDTTVQAGANTSLFSFSETLTIDVFTPTSPEPTTIVLMASGFTACLLTGWKRRRKL